MMTDDRLSAATRVLIAGDVVSALGTGLVLPLTLIYLHQVRHVSLPVVGALMALSAGVGLLVVPLSGILLDRLGARTVLVAVLAGQALAYCTLAWAHSAATAVPAMFVLGTSMSPFYPAFAMMLAGINPQPRTQQRAFAMSFTAINAGIGVGGAIGAAVANVHHPRSFAFLFLANALSCLVFAVVISRLPDVRERHRPTQAAKAGYREVLAQRGLRTVMLATLALAFCGYAAMDSGLPAYATIEARLSVHVVALAITVNTVVIVAAQLLVLRLVRRLRRSRALAAIGLIWALSWAIFGLSALPAPGAVRIGCVFCFAGLFGIGEMVLSPTVAPLVNRLADDRVRGRANALSTSTYSLATVVSPAICTSMIAAGLSVLWLGLLCAGGLTAALLGLRLGGQLTPADDHVTQRQDVATAPEPTPI